MSSPYVGQSRNNLSEISDAFMTKIPGLSYTAPI
jgi:hypothetical protein